MYEANAVVLLELFVIYLMIAAGGHLDILAMRLKKLGTSNNQETNSSELVECIELHLSISKFVSRVFVVCEIYEIFASRFQNSIEQSFSVPYFIQFIISGIILCISCFQIVIVSIRMEH